MSHSYLITSGANQINSPFSGTNPVILFILSLYFSHQFSVETSEIYFYLHLFIKKNCQTGAYSITLSTAVDHENYMAPCYRVKYAIY